MEQSADGEVPKPYDRHLLTFFDYLRPIFLDLIDLEACVFSLGLDQISLLPISCGSALNAPPFAAWVCCRRFTSERPSPFGFGLPVGVGLKRQYLDGL